LKYGSSPAYWALTDFTERASLDIVYVIIILTLVALPVLLVLSMVAVIINLTAYYMLFWPLRRIRALRVIMRFWRRGAFLKIDRVRSFAESTQDVELMRRVQQYGRPSSIFFDLLPFGIFAVLIALVAVSDEASPNFLMLTCSLREVTVPCGLYHVILALSFFNLLLIMAMLGFTTKYNDRFPVSQLTVSPSEIRKHKGRSVHHQFQAAQASWMKGKSRD